MKLSNGYLKKTRGAPPFAQGSCAASGGVYERGSAPVRRVHFFEHKEMDERNAARMARPLPALRAFAVRSADRTSLSWRPTRGVPPHAPSGLRAKACSLGRAIRGPRTTVVPTPLLLPPRRRASVEEGPKSSPKGCARDRTRAHPAQGCAVCAPPEANRERDGPAMLAGEAFRGKMALVTFPERKVTRGCRGRSTPLNTNVAEGDTTHSAG